MQPLEIAEAQPDFGANRASPGGDRRIGQYLVFLAKIRDSEIDRVLSVAAKKRMRFGEAAIKLRLITRQDLNLALSAQYGYPYLEKGAGGYSQRLVAAYDPFGDEGNALRVLRAELRRRWFSTGERALALLGPSGREGCSHLAANLSVMFSQAGLSTVLVDTDFKGATQHELFRVNNDAGLSAALVGRMPVEKAVQRLPLFRNLSLVTAGIAPPNMHDLLWREEMTHVIATLKERHEVVIFDTPPFVENLGADNVAERCGGALVVVRKNHTAMNDARRALEVIEERGSRVVGTALRDF